MPTAMGGGTPRGITKDTCEAPERPPCLQEIVHQ
jgi:hypothetical protein